MYSKHYIYSPQPPRFEEHRDFGWNSCMLFITALVLLTLYTLLPAVSLVLALTVITGVATLGTLIALYSLAYGKIWLSKVYATCGLMGNLCLLLWLLLSL